MLEFHHVATAFVREGSLMLNFVWEKKSNYKNLILYI